MKTKFEKIQQVIDNLNSDGVNYLILRNYENLLDDQIYVNGHEDLDILCQNPNEVIESLGAISNRKKEDKTHYHIFVGENRVNLDLRYLGDGYYCYDWQYCMLNDKILYKSFYVMDSENYFYSLIYHAIIQKKKFSEEYRSRLEIMAKSLGLEMVKYNRDTFLLCLQKFMIKKGYFFVYCEDPSIPVQFNLINKELLNIDFKRKYKHQYFIFRQYMLNLLYKLYKAISRKK